MSDAMQALFPEAIMKPLPPPLKWAGGKRWLAPRIKAIYDHFRDRRFVEPFVGGMSVTLTILPEKALLNDINEHLINFYMWLQRGLKIDVELKNDERTYYLHRERFNRLIKDPQLRFSAEAAALFYYLNRTGFNGLCRFNSKGEFNVPYGKYRKINYKTDFTDYQQVMSKWEFKAGDFSQIELRSDDFIYADPPYDVEFTKYSTEGFSWKDQERLAEWLAAHSGPVLISNQATPRILRLYERLGFEIALLEAPRMISSNGNREKAFEILAWRNIPSTYMAPGDTSSGISFERSLQEALEKSGYVFYMRGSGRSAERTFPEPIPSSKQRKMFVLDGVIIDPTTRKKIGLSAKWQQVAGTAEEKVPLEFLRLALLIQKGFLVRAYIVLGGSGWTLKDYYLSDEFVNSFALEKAKLVRVVSEEEFVYLAAQKLL